jgi:hypothetical protein
MFAIEKITKQWLNLLGLMEQFSSIEKVLQVTLDGMSKFLRESLQNPEKAAAT